jgi:hypothetical protein
VHQALDLLRRIATGGVVSEPDALIRLLAAQLGIFGAGALGPRGLIAKIALGKEGSPSFAMLLDGIAGAARTRATIEDEIGRFGRYTLLRKLPCSPPEECFFATDHGRRGDVFVRTFPRDRLDDRLLSRFDAWKRAGLLYDFGVVEHRPFLASEPILGCDLTELSTPSAAIVLAWIAEGLDALDAIHGSGELHGHLTAKRIRIEPLGNLRMCVGTSQLASSESRGSDVCTFVRLLLERVTDDAKLMAVLRADDTDALVVAADRLVEIHPELDDLVSAVLWKRAPAEELVPLLERHITRDEALALIGKLVESARA